MLDCQPTNRPGAREKPHVTRPHVSHAALHGKVTRPRGNKKGLADREGGICPRSRSSSPATPMRPLDKVKQRLLLAVTLSFEDAFGGLKLSRGGLDNAVI